MQNKNYSNWHRAVIVLVFLISISVTSATFAELGDLVLPRKSTEAGVEAIPASKFPHWIHRVQYRCDACHNRLFPMELGATYITMDLIGEGQQCGACHNGEQAFEVGFSTCNRCHARAEE